MLMEHNIHLLCLQHLSVLLLGQLWEIKFHTNLVGQYHNYSPLNISLLRDTLHLLHPLVWVIQHLA